MKNFGWWLTPKKETESNYTILGTVIVLALYVIIMVIFWKIS